MDDDVLVAAVARRYFVEEVSKSRIADEMGVSRFKVARLLDQARRDGVVTIEVRTPTHVDLPLSERVARLFSLRQVVAVRPADPGPAGLRRALGAACGSLLAHRLTEDDVLGVSWGRTLQALADESPALPPADVVQLVGSIPGVDLDVGPLELVRRLGHRTGGRVHPLHVPAVLPEPGLAAALRATDPVRATLAAHERLTHAVVGVGAWAPTGSSLRPLLPPDVVRACEEAGAVAETCSTVLDAEGQVVAGSLVPDHCVAVTTDRLRAVRDVVAVAAGAEKVEAVRAVVRAGLVHHLVTDVPTARALLAGVESPEG